MFGVTDLIPFPNIYPATPAMTSTRIVIYYNISRILRGRHLLGEDYCGTALKEFYWSQCGEVAVLSKSTPSSGKSEAVLVQAGASLKEPSTLRHRNLHAPI